MPRLIIAWMSRFAIHYGLGPRSAPDHLLPASYRVPRDDAGVCVDTPRGSTLIDADPNAPLAFWAKRFPDAIPQGLTVKVAFRTDVVDVIDSASTP